MENLAVAFQVVADFESRGNVNALFDNRLADLGARANRHVGEEDRFFDLGVFLDGNRRGEDALDDATAADDAASGDHGIDCRPRVLGIASAEESCGRLVPVERANRPVVVVEVKRRIFRTDVHVRFEEGVEGSHVAPVALCLGAFSADDVRVEVIDIDGEVRIQRRDNVLAEIRRPFARMFQKFAD